jgi:hypothetical protein
MFIKTNDGLFQMTFVLMMGWKLISDRMESKGSNAMNIFEWRTD